MKCREIYIYMYVGKEYDYLSCYPQVTCINCDKCKRVLTSTKLSILNVMSASRWNWEPVNFISICTCVIVVQCEGDAVITLMVCEVDFEVEKFLA